MGMVGVSVMTPFEESKQAIQFLNKRQKTLELRLKEIQKELEEIASIKKDCIKIILDSFK